MSFCANLTEKNTKRITFKFVFSVIMMAISLMVYPQASLTSPYEVFMPPNFDADVSIYLTADSVSVAKSDLKEIYNNGINTAIIMPNMTKLNESDIKTMVSYSKGLGLKTGLSLGGTILSNETYMSDAYQSFFLDVVNGLLNKSVFDDVFLVEFLPYINAPDDYYATEEGVDELLFGASYDDVIFLGNLINKITDKNVTTRTTVHMSYMISYRTLLKRLGDITNLDQIGISIFQPHLNAIPTALANGVAQARRVTDKEIVIGQIGFSTHDDVHNEYMQDAWFWNCMDVATSYSVKELGLWQWKDKSPFPFIVLEILEPRYGVQNKTVMNSVTKYGKGDGINYIGYATNIIEVVLGTFSTTASTGVISGNIWFSLLLRILMGALIGRKCKVNGKLLTVLLFSSIMVFHFSMGVVISNSPTWWYVFPTYFYLYASLTAGIFQIQVVSTIVRHKKVFSFCEDDAKKCSADFFQA